MLWHMLQDTKGKFYVVYRVDKRKTIPMRYSEAKGYADIFGGEIYFIN